MQRTITDFHQDEEKHWAADLSCGHSQHMRHNPPWMDRPWVITEEGRQSRLGEALDCVRCDEREIPARAEKVKTTTVFTEATVPAGFLKEHRTAAGMWGKLVVIEGTVKYTIFEPYNEEQELSNLRPGIIVPEVSHKIEASEKSRFHIEFWKVGASS